MLYEIYCDKFVTNKGKENEQPRGRITFEKGLNVVQGENSGRNAIGKSSFLLAVDYCFAGEDYAKDEDIIAKIGHHTICFCFDFGEKRYFSRNTFSSDTVYECDSDYVPLENGKLTINEFRSLLLKNYNIKLPNTTFRGIVSLFFRIAGRDTVKDQEQPLLSDIREKVEASLVSFLKLYDKYAPIEDCKKNHDAKAATIDAYKKANAKKVIKLITPKQFEKNLQDLVDLQVQLDNIITQGGVELTLLDENITEQAMELKANFDALSRQKRILWAKYYAFQKSMELRSPASQQDFDELLKYFPDSQLQDLKAIENFHSKLSVILVDEFKKARANIYQEITDITDEMYEIEKEMQAINLPQQISKKTIKTCGELSAKMQRIQSENEVFVNKQKFEEELKLAEQEYSKIFISQFAELEKELNPELTKLNKEIYSDTQIAPELNVLSTTEYKYKTPFNRSTGVNYKNMILLDLATLRLTPLPLLVHDTIIFKNIDKPTMGKIIEIYKQHDEQIFISFDEKDDYPDEAAEIVEKCTRINLSYGGNELFGESWSESKQTDIEV